MKRFTHKGCEYELLTMTLGHLPELLEIEKKSHSHPWSEASFTSSIASSHHCSVLVDQSATLETVTLEAASLTSTATENTVLNTAVPERIAAYIITSTAADEAELLNVVVAPKYRRRGLANLLIEESCDSFNPSIHSLFLEVRASNAGAISLYDNLGFNEVGCRLNYYPADKNNGREDALIMAKTLIF